jgi:hypothetical protein
VKRIVFLGVLLLVCMSNAKSNGKTNEYQDSKTRLILAEDWRNVLSRLPEGRFSEIESLLIKGPNTVVQDLRLDRFVNLKRLTFIDPTLRRLSLPAAMNNLELLSVRDANLENLCGVSTILPKLKVFSIVDSGLKNLVGMPNDLPSLELLVLRGNELRDVQGMPAHVPALGTVELVDNELVTLEGFSQDVPRIDWINLSKNPLQTFAGLPLKMPTLNIISLERITSLPDDQIKRFHERYPKVVIKR